MLWFIDLVLGSLAFALACAQAGREWAKRKSPPRLWFFAETPSTCSVVGHQIEDGECIWCDGESAHGLVCLCGEYFTGTGGFRIGGLSELRIQVDEDPRAVHLIRSQEWCDIDHGALLMFDPHPKKKLPHLAKTVSPEVIEKFSRKMPAEGLALEHTWQ